MFELLATLPLKDIGAVSLVTLIVLMILFDKLITKQRLLDEREEKNHWRTAAENLQQSFDKLSDSTSRTVILAEATNHALTEIQALATRTQQGQEARPS